MIKSVGIDFHQGKHIVRCLDEKVQLCDSFNFETTQEGLTILEERIFRDGSNPVIVFEPAGLSWLILPVISSDTKSAAFLGCLCQFTIDTNDTT